ncbi:MAG: [FeFe] hydrogenase H-cluster radical SAM maturase HydE [Candidatus Gastranaerophilales bacterium]|nr:[FeFe] hydrogenase H-cluster radical SAM maturase HydE [Candidatus Gastranaerophilales bacterium]
MQHIEEILQKASEAHNLSKEEILLLLREEKNPGLIFQTADEVRKKYIGDEIHLRGLIEFSNICKCDCIYCGLRYENKHLERYRLSKDEIIDFARKGAEMGYKTVVMQSGEDIYFNTDLMCEIIKEVKKFDLAITLSIGERSYEDYKDFKEAGADRYLLRIETTDKDLYNTMHPDMSFDNRLQCLKNLKSLGYEVGSGCLVGLPEQTLSSLADDIFFFKNNDFDMIGIGPFIPNPNTPLAGFEGQYDNFTLSLKVMAITRLLLPDINIPATTAMETLNPNGRIIALKSGANVVMPNITEGDYRRKYEIYPNKICINDTPSKCRGCISGKINMIGRKVSSEYGFRKKNIKSS